MTHRNCGSCGAPWAFRVVKITRFRRVKPKKPRGRPWREIRTRWPSALLKCYECKYERVANVRESKTWFQCVLSTRAQDLVGIGKLYFRGPGDAIDSAGSVLLPVPVRPGYG